MNSILNKLSSRIKITDEEFDSLYPEYLRELSSRHFSQYNTTMMAAQLLADRSDRKILDIGSGVGKFCLIASQVTNAQYTGIEVREDLVQISQNLAQHLIQNQPVFVHGCFTELDFSKFDAFYFFNSFEEYINPDCTLDAFLKKSDVTFHLLRKKLIEKLKDAPLEARVVTYYIKTEHLPDCYKLISTHEDDHLKLWVKFK